MNILFVANFPIEDNKGGVQRVTATLAQAFLRLGHQVCYLSLGAGQTTTLNGVEQFFMPNNTSLPIIENRNFYKALLEERSIDVVINQAGIYGHVIQFLSENHQAGIKLLTAHHNCIQCLQESYRNILMGSTYAKLLKYFDFPWMWSVLLGRNKRKYGTYFREAIKKSDQLVLLSPYFIPELKTYLSSWPEHKVSAIYNPVPFEKQPQVLGHKENRLLYLGRVEYTQKQCNLLLPIWEQVQLRFPDWHFDIVGGGSKLKELKQLASDKGLRNIHFYGFTDPKPFLEKAKFLCMTSSFEGYGMVLVEAQAYGVVPIAFNSFSALPSIISQNETGILIPPFDVPSYIEQLVRLMGNEAEQSRMAEQAQQSITKFAPETIALQWVELINTLT